MKPSLGKLPGTVGAHQGGSFAGGQGRTVLPDHGKPARAEPLPPLGRNQLIKEWQSIVLQFPIKQASEEQDVTTKAIQGQRNGDSCPEFLSAINQGRANPRVRAQILRLLGFTGACTDPDFMQGMELLAQSYTRQQFSGLGFPLPETAPGNDSPNSAGEEHDHLTGDLFSGVIH